jgi:hypothetical protein|tara:strand:+ start:21 stop:527 length:507 start_codon:yes stop_codon:yes gene_type:complete
MALWGTKDTVYSTGNVNLTASTGVVAKQSGSIAWTSGNGVKVGQVITIDGTTEGVIESIDSATQLTIGTEYLSGNLSNKTYEIREKPKSTLHDSNWATSEIYGVDTTEITVANAASGNARKYAPPHAGWVGITTYNDNAGNLRVKSEVLVAGSTISADSGDDALLPDS